MRGLSHRPDMRSNIKHSCRAADKNIVQVSFLFVYTAINQWRFWSQWGRNRHQVNRTTTEDTNTLHCLWETPLSSALCTQDCPFIWEAGGNCNNCCSIKGACTSKTRMGSCSACRQHPRLLAAPYHYWGPSFFPNTNGVQVTSSVGTDARVRFIPQAACAPDILYSGGFLQVLHGDDWLCIPNCSAYPGFTLLNLFLPMRVGGHVCRDVINGIASAQGTVTRFIQTECLQNDSERDFLPKPHM